jgi:rod shape-determining protein MreD
VTLTLVILTALLLQTTVFAEFRLGGARPELVYLVTILFAINEGPASGAIVGFSGGMAQDFLTLFPKGVTALTCTLLGYVMGLVRQYVVSPSPVFPVMLVAGGTLFGVLFNRLVAFLLGQFDTSFTYMLRIALLSALYNAILTPFLAPVLRRASESSTGNRVMRW